MNVTISNSSDGLCSLSIRWKSCESGAQIAVRPHQMVSDVWFERVPVPTQIRHDTANPAVSGSVVECKRMQTEACVDVGLLVLPPTHALRLTVIILHHSHRMAGWRRVDCGALLRRPVTTLPSIHQPARRR